MTEQARKTSFSSVLLMFLLTLLSTVCLFVLVLSVTDFDWELHIQLIAAISVAILIPAWIAGMITSRLSKEKRFLSKMLSSLTTIVIVQIASSAGLYFYKKPPVTELKMTTNDVVHYLSGKWIFGSPLTADKNKTQFSRTDNIGDGPILIDNARIARDEPGPTQSSSTNSNELLNTVLGEDDLNREILEFVDSSMDKTIGSGECWDLAQEALDTNNAAWSRPFKFGRLINPDEEPVIPGDIIQFSKVKTENERGWKKFGMPDHTAVVVEVLNPGHYKIAHQNVQNVRKVMFGECDLSNVVEGHYEVYRPVRNTEDSEE